MQNVLGIFHRSDTLPLLINPSNYLITNLGSKVVKPEKREVTENYNELKLKCLRFDKFFRSYRLRYLT